jgi:hypothetical protein
MADEGVGGMMMVSMEDEVYDEQLFAEVEAEIGTAADEGESDEELAKLEAEVAALVEEDMLLEGKWVRKDGKFQKVSLQESIELQLENEVEQERRARAQSTSSVGREKLPSGDSSEDEETRSLRAEVAALEEQVAAQEDEADLEALAKIKVGLSTIQAHEKAEREIARTNSEQAEMAANDIANGAAQQAVRILAEEQSAAAAVAALSETVVQHDARASSPASALHGEQGGNDNGEENAGPFSPSSSAASSDRAVVDDNIEPWIREMQQYVCSCRTL